MRLTGSGTISTIPALGSADQNLPSIRVNRVVWIGGLQGLGALLGFVIAYLAIDLRYAQTLGAVFGEPLEPA